MIESRCGLLCHECTYQEQAGCQGCINIKHEHCGQCENFLCDLLKQFSYDEKQGDNRKRIKHCRYWLEKQR